MREDRLGKRHAEARDLREGELDELLSLYAHMHAVDDPLPERRVAAGILR